MGILPGSMSVNNAALGFTSYYIVLDKRSYFIALVELDLMMLSCYCCDY